MKSILQTFFKEWLLVIILIFGGCCSNVYSLEVLTRNEPSSGNLITLFQFLFIALEGLVFQIDGFGFKKRKVPIQNWGLMVCLFWTVSILNNYALRFNIPMPLHIIFRSGSVMISMLIGWIFFNRKFTLSQILGVILVTVGVVMSTLASANVQTTTKSESTVEFGIGIGVLTVALILSCLLGQYQQIVYTKYGRHWREGLFYTHALCLPMFGLFYTDILSQIKAYSSSPLLSIGEYMYKGILLFYQTQLYQYFQSIYQSSNVSPLLVQMFGRWIDFEFVYSVINALTIQVWAILDRIEVPSQWLFLALNVATQFVCINGVSMLTSMTSSVTVNLVLSIRKFVSLFISIYIFNNAFTIENWVGSFLVFVGTLIYAGSNSPKQKVD